tara:strand:- start:375 stop:1802 length:1428 start_codon:yes stop_codon:yes gene_type:complete
MIAKLTPQTSGIISSDSTLKSIYIPRNGVNNYFSISSDNSVVISIFTIEDVSSLKFNIDEKSSVVLNESNKTIVVTAENGSQTSYSYTLENSSPYSGAFPLVNSIQANSIDGLVSKPNKEIHSSYNISIVDLILQGDSQNTTFGGNVFAEYQGLGLTNSNIPSDLATALSSTGFAYYIVGFGDGLGGSDWSSHPNFATEYLYYRVSEDATKFDTTATSKINLSELNQVYGMIAPETFLLLDSTTSYNNYKTALASEYASFTDVSTFKNALTSLSQSFSTFGSGQDIEPSDIESYPLDITIEQAIALNTSRSLEVYTLDDLYSLNTTIATRLKASDVANNYPFMSQFCDEILNGDNGYVPSYSKPTISTLKSEVLSAVEILFADPMFWLSELGLGFVNTKFIYDRFKFINDNYSIFDYKLSKESVNNIVVALNDLITYYYNFGESNGTALLPNTYVLLSNFATNLISSENNTLSII